MINQKVFFNPITGDYILEAEEIWLTHYTKKRVPPFYGCGMRSFVINIDKNLPTFDEVPLEKRKEFISKYVDFFVSAAFYNEYPEYVEMVEHKSSTKPATWNSIESAKKALNIEDKDVDVESPYN